jgi:hypothetical protein
MQNFNRKERERGKLKNKLEIGVKVQNSIKIILIIFEHFSKQFFCGNIQLSAFVKYISLFFKTKHKFSAHMATYETVKTSNWSLF